MYDLLAEPLPEGALPPPEKETLSDLDDDVDGRASLCIAPTGGGRTPQRCSDARWIPLVQASCLRTKAVSWRDSLLTSYSDLSIPPPQVPQHGRGSGGQVGAVERAEQRVHRDAGGAGGGYGVSRAEWGARWGRGRGRGRGGGCGSEAQAEEQEESNRGGAVRIRGGGDAQGAMGETRHACLQARRAGGSVGPLPVRSTTRSRALLRPVQMLSAKKLSSKINYEALSTLFGPDEEVPSEGGASARERCAAQKGGRGRLHSVANSFHGPMRISPQRELPQVPTEMPVRAYLSWRYRNGTRAGIGGLYSSERSVGGLASEGAG